MNTTVLVTCMQNFFLKKKQGTRFRDLQRLCRSHHCHLHRPLLRSLLQQPIKLPPHARHRPRRSHRLLHLTRRSPRYHRRRLYPRCNREPLIQHLQHIGCYNSSPPAHIKHDWRSLPHPLHRVIAATSSPSRAQLIF
ncbi:hypothetical protein Syun_007295 [Stephania yunnanensis]|uniref:Uncharacterized protein n=1 Tax=Stephania yunnanensis TaxID=152371 RepID=A0AAP0KZZ6_9MAGN